MIGRPSDQSLRNESAGVARTRNPIITEQTDRVRQSWQTCGKGRGLRIFSLALRHGQRALERRPPAETLPLKLIVRDGSDAISMTYRSDGFQFADSDYEPMLAVLSPYLEPGSSILDLG